MEPLEKFQTTHSRHLDVQENHSWYWKLPAVLVKAGTEKIILGLLPVANDVQAMTVTGLAESMLEKLHSQSWFFHNIESNLIESIVSAAKTFGLVERI